MRRRSMVAAVVFMTTAVAACSDGGTSSGFGGEGGDPGEAGHSTENAMGLGGSGGAVQTSGGAPSDGGGGGIQLMGEPCDVHGREGVCVDVSECTIEGWAPTPGFCPGPAEIQCCTPVAEECDPEARPLPNAGVEEAPGEGGCLPGMIRIDDFCIDQYEAFLVTLPGLDPVSPYFNPGDENVMAMSAYGAVPQGYINEWQATDACANAGKRLCTNEEWLRVCRGTGANIYPYGNTLDVGVCNDHRDQHPAIEYFMSSEDWVWSELGHPCINQLDASLATTGAFEGCVTEDGAFDMMGNLHEWTSDPNGTFRGGFYVDTENNGPGCLYATTAHDGSHWDYSTGFRCCGDL